MPKARAETAGRTSKLDRGPRGRKKVKEATPWKAIDFDGARESCLAQREKTRDARPQVFCRRRGGWAFASDVVEDALYESLRSRTFACAPTKVAVALRLIDSTSAYLRSKDKPALAKAMQAAWTRRLDAATPRDRRDTGGVSTPRGAKAKTARRTAAQSRNASTDGLDAALSRLKI